MGQFTNQAIKSVTSDIIVITYFGLCFQKDGTAFIQFNLKLASISSIILESIFNT